MDGIVDQRLPFLFEVWMPQGGAPTDSFVLPINPEDYRKSESPRVSITHTKGGAHEDNVGNGLPRITLSGSFGYLGSLPGGGGRHASGLQLCGADLYKELEDIFLRFYRKYGELRTQAGPFPILHFHNFADEAFYHVSIERFDLLRSTRHRHIYRYQIDMIGLERLDAPQSQRLAYRPTAADTLIDDVNTMEALDDESLGVWGSVLAGYTKLSTKVNDVINQIDEVKAKVTTVKRAVGAFKQSLTDLVEAPFGLIGEIRETFDSILDNAEDIGGLPHELRDLLLEEKRKIFGYERNESLFVTADTSTSAASAEDVSPTRPEIFEISTAELPTNLVVDGFDLVSMDIPEESLFSSDISTAREVAVAEVAITDGASLEGIAHQALGSGLEWKRIADLNGLEYPYIVCGDPYDAYTEELQRGVTMSEAKAYQRGIAIDGVTPDAGQLLVFNLSDVLHAATVESVVEGSSGLIVNIETPFTFAIPSGTVVTVHERALSVLLCGQKIKIPKLSSQASQQGDSSDGSEAKLFKVDEALDANGEHVAAGGGGISTLSGLENLQAQLQHRLNTLRGELGQLGHPGYGSLLPMLIGKAGTPMWMERAKFEAKMVVLEDPRIERVVNVKASMEGTSILFEADAIPVNTSSAKRLSLVVGQ